MAAQRKTTGTTKTAAAKRRTSSRRATPQKNSLMDYFRIGESYTSLVLGIIVVIVISVLLLSLFKTRNEDNQQGTSSTSTVSEKADVTGETTYTVQPGDDLWQIAVEKYGDGYKWTLIAEANKLEDPGVLFSGTKLIIPDVPLEEATKTSPTTPTPLPTDSVSPTQVPTPTQVAQATQPSTGSITGTTYSVVTGDDLWDIAVKAYGDGYRWVDIARANNLVNPDIIHAGNQLQIPR